MTFWRSNGGPSRRRAVRDKRKLLDTRNEYRWLQSTFDSSDEYALVKRDLLYDAATVRPLVFHLTMPKLSLPSRFFLFVAGLIGAMFVAFLVNATQNSAPVPLIGAGNSWSVTGDFPKFSEKLPPLQVPPSFEDTPEFTAFRSWRPGGVTQGSVASPPFVAPDYIAVPYARGGERGYPDADDIRIECMANGAYLVISSTQTFDEWSVAYRKIPEGFCGGKVRLVAVARAATGGSYIGVATPFAVSRAMYYAHSGFYAKGLVVFATWFIFCAIFLASALSCRAWGYRLDSFGVGALSAGAAGMIVFVFGVAQAKLAESAAVALFTLSAAVVAYSYVRRRSTWNELISELRLPLFCWLAVSMTLVAFVCGADSGGGRWAVNGLFSPLSWSVDNQNPVFFAESFVRRTSNQSLTAGAWLFDDRTPLLTLLLILPQTLIIHPLTHLFGLDFAYEGDSVAAITLLSFWMPVLVWLMRKLRLSHPRLFFYIVAVSPFLLFNTVYTWGKLLGAAYVILAVGVMLSMPRDKYASRPNLGLIPLAFALAYLAHAGNAIAAAAFLLMFAPTLRMRDAKILLIGTVVAVVVFAPWFYWTHFVQPGGNALTRFQLADDLGFDHRSKSVLASVTEHLKALGWSQWVYRKEQSFRLLVDVWGRMGPFGRPIDTASPTMLGSQRAIDFIVVSRTIGIASFGVVGIVLASILPGRRRADPLAVRLALCGVVGLVMMTLLITQIGVTHHHSYASVMMLGIAGAMYISEEWPRLGKVLYVLWLLYFLVAWIIDPVRNADQLHPGALLFGLTWLVALCWAVEQSSIRSSTQADHRRLWTGVDSMP
ncbi:hypothetical protein NK8_21840 [Caballeronia sp. NK8]|uniref:hypothetical protein n=1 Tax=Caballeronia sp. NK8 TaxID=140098 RepID=UPI001BB5EDCC|nr:hypothetical protein [Caballeronia sp. NK8]BCQ24032.1 hypothetical protein NK8_21840 [Caballeronia sp. NK8]